jgi:hypothetical protein
MGIIINGLTDTVTASDQSLNLGGNVTIPGELSYDDVTNIDSVGVVTARAGINATGDITFGTNSKAKLFENGTQSGVQATSSTSSAHLMTHDGNEDIHVDPSGYIKFEVAGLERLRITSDGKIGVGVASPQQKLDVVGSAHTVAVFRPDDSTISAYGNAGVVNNLINLRMPYGSNPGSANNNGARWGIIFQGRNDGAEYGTDSSKSASIYAVSQDATAGYNRQVGLAFYTSDFDANQTERLRIRSDGKLMTQAAGYIYTTSSAGSLSLYGGNTNLGGGIVLSGGNTNGDIRFYAQMSTSSPAERLRIDSDGCVRVGNTHSQTTSSNTKRIALGAKGSIWGWTSGNINGALTLADNYYWDGANNRAIEADNAAYLSLRSGTLRFGTTDSTPSAGGVTGLTEKFRITTAGNVSVNHDNPNTRLYVRDSGATVSNGNAILNSTQKGIRLVNSNNNDTSLGLWFTTGDSHHAGISGQRSASASNWGTDLRFYTHEGATNDLTYTRERLRISCNGLLNNRKGQNAVNTGGTILGRYKYTQQNQSQNYEHNILGPDGRNLNNYLTQNVYAKIRIQVTGTGTTPCFCEYYYNNNSSVNSAALTFIRGNNSASSNRPYMVLNGQLPAWKMNHSGGYILDIEVAMYGGKESYTYTTEYGNFGANP